MGRVSMPQGKGSQMHNRRDYDKYGLPTPDNIDTSKSNLNITLVDRDIRESYQEIFGEALAEYNSRQKRADRKINDYYDHIAKSKNGEKLFYEDVIQWGKLEDFSDSPEMRQKACEALKLYVDMWEQRNPNLKLIGAYIHMDEASPHLHLDYIPVAHGYSRGMSVRNSLDRAMKEMGFVPDPEKESKKNNATKLWKENERNVFAMCCIWCGLEVEEERKARGSLSVEEYKEAKDKLMGSIEQERGRIEKEIASNSDVLSQQAQLIEQQKSIIEGNGRMLDSQEKQIKETEKKLSDLRVSEYSKQNHISRLNDTIEAKSKEVSSLEQQKKDLEGLVKSLNANIDKFFVKVINTFKKGLSEARKTALEGILPDSLKDSMEKIEKAEERAMASIDSIKTDRVSVREKLEENKQKVKETAREEASAEKEEVQQIARRRRGR